MRVPTYILDKLRAWPWLCLALSAALVVGWLHPHQLGVLVWSLTKISLAAYLGYWVYRSLHPYARVKDLSGPGRRNAMLVRALIVSATIIALGLGL